MGLPRAYPLHDFPFAQTAEEEAYFQRVHYFASALWVYGAGDEVLAAMHTVWQQAMDRGAEPVNVAPLSERRPRP